LGNPKVAGVVSNPKIILFRDETDDFKPFFQKKKKFCLNMVLEHILNFCLLKGWVYFVRKHQICLGFNLKPKRF
jgi:hypothetical protein